MARPLTPDEHKRRNVVFRRIDSALAGAFERDPERFHFTKVPKGWRRNTRLWRIFDALLDRIDTDMDTGLRSKTAFAGDLNRIIKKRVAEQNPEPCSLVILDINYFKSINDDIGHVYGDYFLAAFADLLQQSTRQNIKANRIPDAIYRLGGDEFALILPNTTQEQAISCMSNILNKIRATTFVFPPTDDAQKSDGSRTAVKNMSFSYGCYPLNPGMNANTVIGQADDILYVHKGRLKLRPNYQPEFKTLSPAEIDKLEDDVVKPEMVRKWTDIIKKTGKNRGSARE